MAKLTKVGINLIYSNESLVHPMLAYIIPAQLSSSTTLNFYQGSFCIAEANLRKKRRLYETFSVGSMKYHFIFTSMKLALGCYTGLLVFSIICNGMFVQLLTFLSCNSHMFSKTLSLQSVSSLWL